MCFDTFVFSGSDDANEEWRIAMCKTSVSQIIATLRASPQSWRTHLDLARTVIAHIDRTSFMQQRERQGEQTWMIAGIQRLAYADADNGDVPDLASWCARQWLIIHQRDPQNIAALRGIGEAWLNRAQPALSRIHRSDGGSSSSGSGSARSGPSLNSSDEEHQTAASIAEAERRAGTADYVEARGYLQPAVEYLDQAVTSARDQQELSGDVLAVVRIYLDFGQSTALIAPLGS